MSQTFANSKALNKFYQELLFVVAETWYTMTLNVKPQHFGNREPTLETAD